LVAGAGWFVLVSPKRSQAAKLAETIQTKQASLSAAQHTHRATGAGTTASARGLNEALPSSLGMPQVVDELNALARRAGVTLDTMTPQPSVNGTGYVTVPLSVVVDGRYFSVEHFLHLVRTQVRIDKNKLSAGGRLFDVQGMTLQQTEPAPSVTATLTLRTFYYSPTANVAPPPTTTPDTSTDSTAA
jgi:Tfp pilus assembly protein PilO